MDVTVTHIDTFTDSSTVPIAVRDFGGRGLPVILIHGLGRSLVDWTAVATLLTARHRVVALDVRGHGASGDGPWSWESADDDIAAVAWRLTLPAPAVAGHSLGGVIAAVWAERHPECPGAISLDGAPWPGPDQCVGMDLDTFRRLRAEADVTFARGLAALAGPLTEVQVSALRAQQRTFYPSEADLDEALGRMLQHRHGQTYLRPSPEWGAEVFRSYQQLDVLSLYRGVRCPLLVVNAIAAETGNEEGGLAPMFAASRRALTRDLAALAAEMPNIQVKNVEAGHDLVFTQTQLVASLMMDFLSAGG
jgi:pimeloyl-ACP methyl ester carboxylesterase